MSYPGYPPGPSQIPGNTGSSMYPPLSGYPAQPGYPPQSQPGYPPQSQPAGYPPSQPAGYPPSQPTGYPPSQPNYPAPTQPGFQPGFMPSQPGYPPQGSGGYPPQAPPAYPPQSQPQPPYGAHPPQSASYPPQPTAFPTGSSPYPSSSPYPPQPSYAPQPPTTASAQPPHLPQGNYPPQATYPPQPDAQFGSKGVPPPSLQPGFSGYPPQQPSFGGIIGQSAMSNLPYPGSGVPAVSSDLVGPPKSYASQYSSVSRITTVSSSAVPFQGPKGRAQYQQEVLKGTPTIRPAASFNPNDDANVLRKAMKGFGTDETAIINVLCRRTNAQRQNILLAYKTAFGKDLVNDLKSELTGKLEKVIVEMMRPLPEYHAHELHKAISGLGTHEGRLVDIMCTSTNAEINEIKAAYLRLYRKPLESDLRGDTSGHFKRLMVSMAVGNRDESFVVDPARAQQAAEQLYHAGEKHLGTDESTFNAVLATQNFAQLRQIFEEYQRIRGHSFETALQRELSGDLLKGMMAIVKCAKNRYAYFAERLHHSMVGMGTEDDLLIWLVVTRSEKDLGDIKQEYHRLYHKTLESAIGSDTSGDYKKALLALIN